MENEIINFENKNFKKLKFISLFESIYEHSDWVIKNVIEDKSNIPNTINELRSAMKKVVNKSSDNLKLKLLRAHPELGIKKNQLSSLTESSQEEQKSAGLDQCSEEEYEEIKSLNKSYKEKFQFPFIIAVKGLNRLDIIKSMKKRVDNNYEEEFLTAINEVHKIAKIRLDALEL
jgi:OHCU decarboxylase